MPVCNEGEVGGESRRASGGGGALLGESIGWQGESEVGSSTSMTACSGGMHDCMHAAGVETCDGSE